MFVNYLVQNINPWKDPARLILKLGMSLFPAYASLKSHSVCLCPTDTIKNVPVGTFLWHRVFFHCSQLNTRCSVPGAVFLLQCSFWNVPQGRSTGNIAVPTFETLPNCSVWTTTFTKESISGCSVKNSPHYLNGRCYSLVVSLFWGFQCSLGCQHKWNKTLLSSTAIHMYIHVMQQTVNLRHKSHLRWPYWSSKI